MQKRSYYFLITFYAIILLIHNINILLFYEMEINILKTSLLRNV